MGNPAVLYALDTQKSTGRAGAVDLTLFKSESAPSVWGIASNDAVQCAFVRRVWFFAPFEAIYASLRLTTLGMAC